MIKKSEFEFGYSDLVPDPTKQRDPDLNKIPGFGSKHNTRIRIQLKHQHPELTKPSDPDPTKLLDPDPTKLLETDPTKDPHPDPNTWICNTASNLFLS